MSTPWNALALAGLIGLAGAAEGGPAANGDVAIDQVPAPVKSAIDRESGGQDVRWVQRGQVDGRDVYTARIKQPGLDKRIIVDANGRLLTSPEWSGSSAGGAADDAAGEQRDVVRSDRVAMEDLPAAVRATLDREAAGADIRSVERDLSDGRSIYHARIGQDGLDRRVSVDEHGALLSGADLVGDQHREGTRSDAPVRDNVDRDLDQDITLEQAPRPVQEALKAQAAGQDIRWVQRDTDKGELVYRARIRQQGLDKRVTIAPDGKVLETKDYGEINARTGKAWEKTKEVSKEAWDKTREATGRAWDRVSDSVSSDTLTVKDLPAKVQDTVQREAKGREIRRVDHQLKDGQHQYDIKFHLPDGQDEWLHLDEEGTVIERSTK